MGGFPAHMYGIPRPTYLNEVLARRQWPAVQPLRGGRAGDSQPGIGGPVAHGKILASGWTRSNQPPPSNDDHFLVFHALICLEVRVQGESVLARGAEFDKKRHDSRIGKFYQTKPSPPAPLPKSEGSPIRP